AVVDVVGAEAVAHQLLEEVGLLVGPLGGAEAGQGVAAIAIEDLLQAPGRQTQSLFPGGLAEVGPGVVGIHAVVPALGSILAPDQRNGKALGAVDVVPAE